MWKNDDVCSGLSSESALCNRWVGGPNAIHQIVTNWEYWRNTFVWRDFSMGQNSSNGNNLIIPKTHFGIDKIFLWQKICQIATIREFQRDTLVWRDFSMAKNRQVLKHFDLTRFFNGKKIVKFKTIFNLTRFFKTFWFWNHFWITSEITWMRDSNFGNTHKRILTSCIPFCVIESLFL